MRILNKKNANFLVQAIFVTLASVSNVKADRLEQIASPVSNPVNFEDPRIETNIKPLYVHHDIDNAFVTQGGSVDVFALQARYAVTEDLAVIATKDGIVRTRPNSVLNDETGGANVAAGVKYAFFKSSENNAIATAGLRYEAPLGASRVLQGEGDGVINPFISGAISLGCETQPINLVGYTGLRVPFDSSDSTFYDASLHVDTPLTSWLSPLFEVNLFQVLDAGNRIAIADEGQDFFNLGASESDGETMITGAAGFRAKLSDNLSWGNAYEFPLVHGEGSRITEWRLTTDLIYKF